MHDWQPDHHALVDRDLLDMLSHVPRKELPYLQDIMIEAAAEDNDFDFKVVKMILATYLSRGGVGRQDVVQAIAGRQSKPPHEGDLRHMPGRPDEDQEVAEGGENGQGTSRGIRAWLTGWGMRE